MYCSTFKFEILILYYNMRAKTIQQAIHRKRHVMVPYELDNTFANKTVNSYGLCVWQLVPGGDTDQCVKFLLVRSGGTYSFRSLIGGRRYYRISDLNQSYADGMSMQEKLRILRDTTNYSYFHTEFRNHYSEKFATWSSRKIRRLSYEALDIYINDLKILFPFLLQSVQNGIDGPLPWSFPKGRKSGKCPVGIEVPYNLQIAISETAEETGIFPEMYQLHEQLGSFSITHVDAGLTYNTTLYFARAKPGIQYFLNPDNHLQRNEISDIRWLSHDDFKNIPMDLITKQSVYEQLSTLTSIVSRFESTSIDRMADILESYALLTLKTKRGEKDKKGDREKNREVEIDGKEPTQSVTVLNNDTVVEMNPWMRFNQTHFQK